MSSTARQLVCTTWNWEFRNSIVDIRERVRETNGKLELGPGFGVHFNWNWELETVVISLYCDNKLAK